MAESIQFFKNEARFRLPSKAAIIQWINKVARTEGYSVESLDFIFCTDSFVHAMNRDILGHDYLTDILTFDLKEGRGKKISGEIYISIDRVRENAVLFKTTFTNELLRVVIHGVLHLMNYDDKTPAKMKKMRAREDVCLKMKEIRAL